MKNETTTLTNGAIKTCKAGGGDGEQMIYSFNEWQKIRLVQGSVETFNSTEPQISREDISQRGKVFDEARQRFLETMLKKVLEGLGVNEQLKILMGLGYLTFDIYKGSVPLKCC